MLIAESCSSPGYGRRVNQDEVCVLTDSDAPPGAEALLIIADGVGGLPSGDIASKLAVRQIADEVCGSTAISDSQDVAATFQHLLISAFEHTNSLLHEAADSLGVQSICTTATAVVVCNGIAILAHIGDSRAYTARSGELTKITTDHTHATSQNYLRQYRPRKLSTPGSVLTRALGLEHRVEPETMRIELQRGDRLVLCTDGLYRVLNIQSLARFAAGVDVKTATRNMISEIQSRKGLDDSSVILAAYEK